MRTEDDQPGMVGILLPNANATGSFAAAAVLAAKTVSGDSNIPIDVRYGHSGAPDPAWRAVLCHGGQWGTWLREFKVSARMPAVMTDCVELHGTDDPLSRITMVDWQWDQAAYLAGAFAARIGEGQTSARRSAAPAIGLLAGPPVPTQRRIAAAYAAGALAAGFHGEIATIHANSFDDEQAGCRIAQNLVRELQCSVIAHTADSAGEAGCQTAQQYGVPTIGFIEPIGAHAAVLDSDVAGVVVELLTALGTGRELPHIFRAGLASGHLDLTLNDPNSATDVDSFRTHALSI